MKLVYDPNLIYYLFLQILRTQPKRKGEHSWYDVPSDPTCTEKALISEIGGKRCLKSHYFYENTEKFKNEGTI